MTNEEPKYWIYVCDEYGTLVIDAYRFTLIRAIKKAGEYVISHLMDDSTLSIHIVDTTNNTTIWRSGPTNT